MSLTIYKRERNRQRWRFHATFEDDRQAYTRLKWLRDFLGDVFIFKLIKEP